jgi:Domain of unknown function (DUF397)
MRALNASGACNDISDSAWRKSSLSAHNGNCVEVASPSGERVIVRDSKNPTSPPMITTAKGWSVFIHDIKSRAVRA